MFTDIDKYLENRIEVEQLKNKVLVTLKRDFQVEPYIDITYIDENGRYHGIDSGVAELNKIKDFAVKYREIIKKINSPLVSGIVFNPVTNGFNMIKTDSNGEYLGNMSLSESINSFFVGYIVGKKDLKYKDKIEILYRQMVDIMFRIHLILMLR